MILLAMDHAPEGKGLGISVVAVNFTYFETLTVFRNTCRAGCVSKKA